jgi:hypothetical protein
MFQVLEAEVENGVFVSTGSGVDTMYVMTFVPDLCSSIDTNML